jgi:hypothetical protein
MVLYRDQNAGQNDNIKTDNKFFERVEQFKYLGTTLKHQYSIQKEIKSTLKSGNECYHSVQNIASSSLLPKKYNGYDTQNYSFAGCFVWV